MCRREPYAPAFRLPFCPSPSPVRHALPQTVPGAAFASKNPGPTDNLFPLQIAGTGFHIESGKEQYCVAKSLNSSKGLDSFVHDMFLCNTTDRPASWRMPKPKEMEKIARRLAANGPRQELTPNDDLPPEYWQALLDDPRAAAGVGRTPSSSGCALRLDQIPQHSLRVHCWRCGRTVEIQKADATRLYGPAAIWREVGQRLLDNTCTQRTGRPSPEATARPSPRSSAAPAR